MKSAPSHLRSVAIALAVGAFGFSLTPANAQTKPAGHTAGSSSVVGIPAPAVRSTGGEPGVAAVHPGPAPAANFYGDSPPGTFTNTEQPANATPSAPVQNLNAAAVSVTGPSANGTGNPINIPGTVAVPQEETGASENPQESPNALIWIVVAGVVLIGSITAIIRYTQPGGQL